ncbi:hypothetical protein [Arthrobacter sp. H41]|uniref:hypothetical protein n=1 Tax=Arthrobacter sp. H41 TaxID=1312978 RepID=UPI0012DD86E7|nr:hypothetical protein [Arthrobacter sp. H41]
MDSISQQVRLPQVGADPDQQAKSLKEVSRHDATFPNSAGSDAGHCSYVDISGRHVIHPYAL